MAELKTARNGKDSIKVNTIRLLLAQLQVLQIAKGEAQSADDEISVLTNEVKKRKEAIKFYEQSHREELKSKEMRELEIISAYLPKQLTEHEIQEIVEKVIQEVGATTIKDLGKVMSTTMKQLKGQADGKLVQEIVRHKLS